MSRRRFYRVVSIIPIDKPSMVIGNGAPKQTGFSQVFGPLVTIRKLADQFRRLKNRQLPMGRHTLQIIDVDGDAWVYTDNDLVRTMLAEDRTRRAARDSAGPRWYELD